MTPAEKPSDRERNDVLVRLAKKGNGTAYAGGYTGKQCQKKWNKYLL